MEHCDAFIIGGSAGSLDVLLKVFPLLNSFLSFPIIIVLHRKRGTDNLLTTLLSSKTNLPLRELEEKEIIEPSTIYIAPSDYHLLIENNRSFSLDASEKINFSRPSIDVIFYSAAEVYKENLVCLLLSGSNNDGIEGLKKVKENGGKAIIQNPLSAAVPFMPAQAALNVNIDKVLEIEDIADYINQLSENERKY
ncbi:MAG TPA: chemotaxis protein CheB [Hanamia sp.]|jgi:two-component system, chemotaxis family, protein-glutamate methylesterase/glutaminase|nr:chemotaxis protein CheB [Hanamia sp.]